MKSTRKTQEKGKYLLLATTANEYNSQLEADRLLTKYFNNVNVARRFPTRRHVSIAKHYFSTYVEALTKLPSPTPENCPMLTSPPFSIQRPYIV